MVDSAGKASITGAESSTTLIVCVAVVMFPEASVAVQVLVMEYDPAQEPVVVTSSKVNVTVPQESVAIACSKAGVAGQFIVV